MVFFRGRDTLKSTLIKTRLSLTSQTCKPLSHDRMGSFKHGVTAFGVQGQANKRYDHYISSPSAQIRFPTSFLSVSFPTISNISQPVACYEKHAGIGCCVPSIKVGDGLFAKVHGRHASCQRFVSPLRFSVMNFQSASKFWVQEFTTPKNGL